MAVIDTERAAGSRNDTGERWGRLRWGRAPDFFSPLVAFPVCWLLGIAISQIHLLNVQRPWSDTAWLVMLWSPVAFLLGGIVGGHVATIAVKLKTHRRPLGETLAACMSSRRPQLVISGLVAVGLAGVTYQFVHAHDIPLLTSHIDAARTSLPGGPSIISLDALVIAATLALVLPENLLSRAALPYLALTALALGALALTGGRGNLIVPPVVAALARWRLGRRPAIWSLAAITVLMLGVFSIIFYLRAGQEAHQTWATELLGRVVYHMPAPLIPLFPLWVAIAMNFNTLARVVEYYPAHHAYGNGIYDAGVLHMFLHSAPLQAGRLTPPWTISTFAGPLWADRGFITLTLGASLIGGITMFMYRASLRSGGLGYLFVSCYMLFLAVFCVYQNLFTAYFDWIVVMVGLAMAGLALDPSEDSRNRERRFRNLLRHGAVGVHLGRWRGDD